MKSKTCFRDLRLRTKHIPVALQASEDVSLKTSQVQFLHKNRDRLKRYPNWSFHAGKMIESVNSTSYQKSDRLQKSARIPYFTVCEDFESPNVNTNPREFSLVRLPKNLQGVGLSIVNELFSDATQGIFQRRWVLSINLVR